MTLCASISYISISPISSSNLFSENFVHEYSTNTVQIISSPSLFPPNHLMAFSSQTHGLLFINYDYYICTHKLISPEDTLQMLLQKWTVYFVNNKNYTNYLKFTHNFLHMTPVMEASERDISLFLEYMLLLKGQLFYELLSL